MQVPLIGVAQAWGGLRADAPGQEEITPTAANLEEQSASYCRHGAAGIVYYAWSGGSVVAMQTPANNEQLAQGVKRGIAACENLWAHSA